MTTVVKRYGPGGTFWKQNPGLPHDYIHEWQIWNEEGLHRVLGNDSLAEDLH